MNLNFMSSQLAPVIERLFAYRTSLHSVLPSPVPREHELGREIDFADFASKLERIIV
jgi:hypothetical protein